MAAARSRRPQEKTWKAAAAETSVTSNEVQSCSRENCLRAPKDILPLARSASLIAGGYVQIRLAQEAWEGDDEWT